MNTLKLITEEANRIWKIVELASHPRLRSRSDLDYAVAQLLIDKEVREAYISILIKGIPRFGVCGFDNNKLERIAQHGLSILRDSELYWLAIYPSALQRIAESLERIVPEWWIEELVSRGDRIVSGELRSWIESHQTLLPGSMHTCESKKFSILQLGLDCNEIDLDRPPRELFSDGWILFPNGMISKGTWTFGKMFMLCEGKRKLLINQIADKVAKKIWDTCKLPKQKNSVTLVPFGPLMFAIGQRVSEILNQQLHCEVPNCLVTDFKNPFLGPGQIALIKHRSVIILTDVVRTGGLVRRISELCKSHKANHLESVSLIDTSNQRSYKSLWKESPTVRTPMNWVGLNVENRCKIKKYYPSMSNAFGGIENDITQEHILTRTDREIGREQILSKLRPLRSIIEEIEKQGKAKIIHWHKKYENKRYRFFLDIDELQKISKRADEVMVAEIERKNLLKVQHSSEACLVHTNGWRSRSWAKFLSRAFGYKAIEIDIKSQKNNLGIIEKYKTVFVVNPVIRTDETLSSIVTQLKRYKNLEIKTLFAINGLSPDRKENLETLLGVKTSGIFDCELPDPDCSESFDVFKERLRHLKNDLDTTNPIDNAVSDCLDYVLHERQQNTTWWTTLFRFFKIPKQTQIDIFGMLEHFINNCWTQVEWLEKHAKVLADHGTESRLLWHLIWLALKRARSSGNKKAVLVIQKWINEEIWNEITNCDNPKGTPNAPLIRYEIAKKIANPNDELTASDFNQKRYSAFAS